jgi:predicted nuclease of predicted toxin-antitoxin system
VKLLLDNNLSPQLVAPLAEQGHDVSHVRDHDLRAAPDRDILDLARRQGRILILVSADTDFGGLLAASRATEPSVVLIRTAGHRRPARQASLLRDNLAAVADALERGALVAIEDTRVRVRDLPIGG